MGFDPDTSGRVLAAAVDPSGAGPRLLAQRVPDGKTVNRVTRAMRTATRSISRRASHVGPRPTGKRKSLLGGQVADARLEPRLEAAELAVGDVEDIAAPARGARYPEPAELLEQRTGLTGRYTLRSVGATA